MAPKIQVPADFGIENLHSALHGNIVLKLQDDRQMTANSMILSYNSPVFVNLFLVLEQSVLEMDDFQADAVNCFIESLYCGEIEIQKSQFQDINKMALVFKVDWLAARCLAYFKCLVDAVKPDTDYNSLVYIFEQARFMMTKMKKDTFLKPVIEKISSLENRAQIFVEPYMTKNYRSLDISCLDLMIGFARDNVPCLIRAMKTAIEKEGLVFDENSRYILQNINLVNCLEEDEALYESFFDFLLEKVEYTKMEDTKMVAKLNRESLKQHFANYKLKQSSSVADILPQPSSSSNPGPTTTVVEKEKISNLFSEINWDDYKGWTVNQFIDYLAESPAVKSMYMFIEGLDQFNWENNETFPTEDFGRLERIMADRGWSRICLDFVENAYLLSALYELKKSIFTAILRCLLKQWEYLQKLILKHFSSLGAHLSFI